MKIKIGICCLFLGCSLHSFAQDFEGYLRYGARFEITDATADRQRIIKRERLEENDAVLVAYAKNGDFLKYIKNIKQAIYTYTKETGNLHTFFKGDKTLTVTNPLYGKGTPVRLKPQVTQLDSVFTINNMECKAIVFDFNFYKSTVYYSTDEKYKGLGKVFYYGSFISSAVRFHPLSEFLVVRFEREYKDAKAIVDLLDFKEATLDSDIFYIPTYKKSKQYDYDDGAANVYKIKDKKYKFLELPLKMD